MKVTKTETLNFTEPKISSSSIVDDLSKRQRKITDDAAFNIEAAKDKIKRYTDELESMKKRAFRILILTIIIAIITGALVISKIFVSIDSVNYLIFSCMSLFLSLSIVYTNHRINILDKEALICNCVSIVKILSILEGSYERKS